MRKQSFMYITLLFLIVLYILCSLQAMTYRLAIKARMDFNL